MNQQIAPRRRAGGRSARRAIRTAVDFEMLPGLRNSLRPTEVMDEEQVHRIDAELDGHGQNQRHDQHDG